MTQKRIEVDYLKKTCKINTNIRKQTIKLSLNGTHEKLSVIFYPRLSFSQLINSLLHFSNKGLKKH